MRYKKLKPREKRRRRIRKKVVGTPERPRLSVFKSNRYVYAQVIDDTRQHTLASAHSLKEAKGGNKAAAARVGKLVAERLKGRNINAVVFDRSGYRFHGVIREVAQAAREAGLKF